MTDVQNLAAAAKNILRIDSELQGFELIKHNIIHEWSQSTLSDKKGREKCFRMLHTLGELERLLRKYIDDAKIEDYKKVNMND